MVFNSKKYNREYMQKFRNEYPWIEALYQARARCSLKRKNVYKYYGGKGIKCLLTKKEIKLLWDRDVNNQMIQPSIDRIDSDDNYVFSNCRFIEYKENTARAKGKAVACISNGKVIQVYSQIKEVAKHGFCKVCVSQTLRGKQKTHKGFEWKRIKKG